MWQSSFRSSPLFISPAAQAARNEDCFLVLRALPRRPFLRLHAVERCRACPGVQVEEVRKGIRVFALNVQIALRMQLVVEGVAADLKPVAAGADVLSYRLDCCLDAAPLEHGDTFAIGIQDCEELPCFHRLDHVPRANKFDQLHLPSRYRWATTERLEPVVRANPPIRWTVLGGRHDAQLAAARGR